MDTGITNQLSGIIAQFEKLDAVVRRVNAANKNMADVVRGMNNVGAGMGGIAAASEKMAKAASDIGRVMPDVTRQAEATAAAMERAASASQRLLTGPAPMLALPPPYSSTGTGFTTQGAPYTPYGYTPNGRPISLPAPGSGLVPFNGGFTMGGGSGPQSTWTPPPGYAGPNAGSLVPSQPFGGAMPSLTLPRGVGPGIGIGGILSGMYQIDMGIRMVERFMELLGKAIQQATDINTELTRLHIGGVGLADRKALEDTSYEVAKQVPGRKISEILADSISMRAIMGDEVGEDKTAAIRMLLPTAEKAAVILKTATGEESPEALARLYKSVELRGDVTDPLTHEISAERFAKGLDAALNLLILGHGLVRTNDLYNATKQGGGSIRSIEDPYAGWASIMTPMLELGGSRTGTGLTAAFRALLGGTMAKHFADEMHDLGLTRPDAQYKQLMPIAGRNGAVIYGKDFLADEDVLVKEGLGAWINATVRDRLAAKGITGAQEINKETYRVMNTETFRRLASIYLTQDAQVQRDILLYKRVPGFDDKFNILKNESAEYANQGMNSSFWNYTGATFGKVLPAWMGFEHFATNYLNLATDMQRGAGPFGYMPNLPGGGLVPGAWLGNWMTGYRASDTTGGSEHPSSAPVDDRRPITMKGDVNLDGKKIGDFTARSIGAQGELPSAGPTGNDLRISIPQPGFVPGYP